MACNDEPRAEMPRVTADVCDEPSPAASTYRASALARYRRPVGDQMVAVCVMCGYGIKAVLEVAHLDQDRRNYELDNLAVLCPNCHKMRDIGLIPTSVVRQMRDFEATEDWLLRMKDAASKAAKTRKANTSRKRRSEAAKRVWAARRNSEGVTLEQYSERPPAL